jgi:hypothetical protein
MMSIVIWRTGRKYQAHVTPPHGSGVEWRTDAPLSSESLISELLARGCHQTDIADALYEADPEWLMRLENDADGKAAPEDD